MFNFQCDFFFPKDSNLGVLRLFLQVRAACRCSVCSVCAACAVCAVYAGRQLPGRRGPFAASMRADPKTKKFKKIFFFFSPRFFFVPACRFSVLPKVSNVLPCSACMRACLHVFLPVSTMYLTAGILPLAKFWLFFPKRFLSRGIKTLTLHSHLHSKIKPFT